MTAFATWLFLGLVVPQLGVEREALKAERFMLMDRASAKSPPEEWFVRMARPGVHDIGNVSVFVSSGRVSAILIHTGQFRHDLDDRIRRDSRCKHVQGEGFVCQLGGPSGAVNAVACGHLVLVYSAASPESRALRSAYCGPMDLAEDDLEKPPESWIQSWLPPERSIPLMLTSLAVVVVGWLVVRQRSKRAERAKR